MTVKTQSYEQATQIEKGGNKYANVFIFKPWFKRVSVMKWKSIKSGYKWQEFDHEEIDYNHYQADDNSYIDAGLCRCCKRKIEHYNETFYKKVFEDNDWNNFGFNEKNGYCKKCALEKAVIENHGWSDFLEVADRLESVRDEQHVDTKYMADGAIIEEMTVREINYLGR